MTAETTPGASAAESAEPAQAENVAAATPDSGAIPEHRFQSVVAQKNEWQKKAEEAQTELAAAREQNKSEQERAMDVYANQRLEAFKLAEHDPLTASAEQMKVALESELGRYRERVPEDKRPASFDLLPLVQQLDAYRTLAETMSTTTTAPAISGGANPGGNGGPPKVWKLSEIRANNQDRVWWAENGPDVKLAQKEGRIDLNA